MSTRRNMLILAAGTALVFAAPAAIAETQGSDAPDVAEPAATVVDTPVVPAPDPAESTPAAPAATPEPEPTTVPESEPASQPETAPAPEPAPQPEAGPTPDAAPSPDSGPKADPSPPAESGSKPASPPRRRTGPANGSAPADSTDSAPRAAQQPPAEPAPAPGSAQGCVITSAGLVCPGDPDCVITSSGVSCASNCTITSAGLSCPSGGEVLPSPPVSGGPKQAPKRKPAPDVEVKPEREEQAEGDISPTAVAPVEQDTTATDDALPFTGAPLLAFLVVGFALWAGGLLLRRRTSSGGTAVERPGDGEPRALPAPPPADAGKPGFRWALVLQTLALLAIGMLLSRRTRR